MAILVSNPTSAAVPTLSGDALDPSVVTPEEGFTEELAAAMQPAGVVSEALEQTRLDKLAEAEQKAVDLQILPAEVLRNAVGDANFALASQASSAKASASSGQDGPVLTDDSDVQVQELYALDLNNNRQSAEQAAANLAAQSAASMAAPPVPQAPLPVAETGQALQAIEASASSVSAQNAPALNTLNPQSDNSTQALANQSMASTASIESQPDNLALGAALQAERAASTPSDAVNTLATSVSSLSSQPQASSVVFANAMANAVANGTGSNETGATQMGNVEALSNKASTTIETTINIAANTNTPPVSSLVASAGALANAAPVAKAVQLAPVATEKPLANQDLNAANTAPHDEESAFNFNAKISSKEAPVLKSLQTDSGLKPVSSLTQAADLSSSPTTRLDLPEARLNEAPAPAESSTAVQSLEDLSSTFVSSLVGGPQRPVNTVMDWISLQAQERPAPVVPHEVRLDSGAVQLEIQKMVKQGGGHVVMELTPPDQSKFTIELKLDERGGALLIVEGVSDSTKTRLEQSAPQLREQFQQMGLELQLDMRQQGQSASSNAKDFSGFQERGSDANNPTGDSPRILTQREAGANRARETGANQVYLYA
jgi:hypothetical protein